VSNAFEIAKDVSELSSEEIGFHLDLCRLCVALTRENRKSLGLIIKEVIYYFTDVASHDLSNPSIQDKFSNEVQLSLQTKLPHLTPSELAVIGSVLKASLTNLEDTACARNNVSSRGIFSASRPPTNEKELNTLYFEGSRAIYANLPCPTAYMTPDGTHAIVSLRETFSSFLALGIDDLRFDPAQLEDPSSSYFCSLAAKAINRRVAATRHPSYPLLKVISIQLKDWGDDAQKNCSRTNLLSFHIRTITFMTLRGNGNVAYYCFIVALGLKSNNHKILERIFNEELAVLSEPNKYYTGKHKNNFLATLNLTASIRDRPARCDIKGLGHHNGLFTQCSLWSAFLDTTLKIELCDVCVFKRRSILREGGILNSVVDGDNIASYSNCLLCADFDYLCTNGVLDVSITHPRDFHYPSHLYYTTH
jgi:hypothetical protein